MRESLKSLRANKAITLIALVITIIVLLILAGVTVATLTGDNGLLSKASNAKQTATDAEIEEEVRLAWNKVYADSYLNNYDINQKAGALLTELAKTGHTDENTKITGKGTILSVEQYRGKNMALDVGTGRIADTKFDLLPTVDKGGQAPKDSNAVYKSGDYIAVIPAGFRVSDVKVVNETTGEVEKDETTIENGLVVRDGSNNEWVWIPVSESDLALMYAENNTEEEWILYGTTGDNKVVSNYKSISAILGKWTIDRANPGDATAQYREPDILNDESYDKNENNRKDAGFLEENGTTSSFEKMAEKLKNDYKEMIDSVRENKGFYVGRYELGIDGNTPQEKAGPVMNRKNWYNLYKSCKYFSNDNVESRMIWGCQWDQLCRFIKGNGENTIINDSSSYGNYSTSTKSTDISGSEKFDNTTGRSEDWKIKNMYDIAGNCLEYTQGVYTTNGRALRGRSLQQQWF